MATDHASSVVEYRKGPKEQTRRNRPMQTENIYGAFGHRLERMGWYVIQRGNRMLNDACYRPPPPPTPIHGPMHDPCNIRKINASDTVIG